MRILKPRKLTPPTGPWLLTTNTLYIKVPIQSTTTRHPLISSLNGNIRSTACAHQMIKWSAQSWRLSAKFIEKSSTIIHALQRASYFTVEQARHAGSHNACAHSAVLPRLGAWRPRWSHINYRCHSRNISFWCRTSRIDTRYWFSQRSLPRCCFTVTRRARTIGTSCGNPPTYSWHWRKITLLSKR